MGVKEMPSMFVMLPGIGFSVKGAAAKGGAVTRKAEEKVEKTVFDLKLEGYDAVYLVEKAPSLIKKVVTKYEAEKIIALLKANFIWSEELYAKLNRMASIAAEMFVGRERLATLLLMRLTETVMVWLSKDQSFWDDIEEGPKPLGPLGLQQFYLDMKFVICFASQGRYLSRNLHRVVNEIISKAMAAFAATGMDPDSVLRDDDWFDDICQEAIERLSGKPKAIKGEREVNSPTASVSAQSISSVRSHSSS